MDKQMSDHIFSNLKGRKSTGEVQKNTTGKVTPTCTALRQTHHSILKNAIDELTRLIPEQIMMKIKGCDNPIESDFLKAHPLLLGTEDTNVLFVFDFDKENLDDHELKLLSSKLMVHFNNDPRCPIYIQDEGGRSHHTVYIRNIKKFKQAKAMYQNQIQLEHKPKPTAQIITTKHVLLEGMYMERISLDE